MKHLVIAAIAIATLLTTVAKAQMKGYFRDAGNDAQDVSIVQLIAQPEKFDGKRVRFIGFLRIEFEGNAIYLHREDFNYGIDRNALWVNIPEDMKNNQQSDVNMRYVICVGVFQAARHGHMGMFGGEITNVRRLELWSEGRSARTPPHPKKLR